MREPRTATPLTRLPIDARSESDMGPPTLSWRANLGGVERDVAASASRQPADGRIDPLLTQANAAISHRPEGFDRGVEPNLSRCRDGIVPRPRCAALGGGRAARSGDARGRR